MVLRRRASRARAPLLCAVPYILVQIPCKGLCPAAVNDPNYALSSSGAENKREGILSLAIH